ncbi:MAG: hypothetical protein EPN50_04370 [Chloroflexota bacterium]|nr:MAG: hypothetical protein EPN50_04370 [Chloroflexota bacterium]
MIRLVLADVDGCLTAGEGRPIDLGVLAAVAARNGQARSDPTVPAISLCTGRPAPYVEILAQAIDASAPSIFENGCGLLRLEPYGFASHPLIDEEMLAAFRAAMDGLAAALVRPGQASWQLGKAYSATLYPIGTSVHALWSRAREQLDARWYVDEGVECINVMPAGIDKGAGVAWLAAETGLALDEIAGVGDADSDLVFLDRIGLAAAPANATAGVRARVDHVADRPHGQGLVEIIDWIAERNAGRGDR